MTDLSTQQCSDISSDNAPLNDEQSSGFLKRLDPQWQLDKETQTISFTYTFKNYYQTMAFANVVAQIAHQQDHHPDMLISYSRCSITYSTHSVGGLSKNDFICAAKINAAQNI
ncbi:MAG: 4a-hydroxytetrahydrobiopterin dehydratase [Gammaproteobacteria bacterium]|jgi:4a-hydroxytetrahydrobiopterin dehydratase|nr:4a-hydroxytetrahydrobiopterin dehydratase [Gammaproteobacteria bacterium]